MTNTAIWGPFLDLGAPYTIWPASHESSDPPSYPTLHLRDLSTTSRIARDAIMLKTRYTNYMIQIWWWIPAPFLPTTDHLVTYEIWQQGVSHHLLDEKHDSPRVALDRIPDLLLELML